MVISSVNGLGRLFKKLLAFSLSSVITSLSFPYSAEMTKLMEFDNSTVLSPAG